MITNVQVEGPWIRVYGHNSERLSQMPYFNLKIIGFSSDYFVTREGPWIITYDRRCHKIGQMLSKKVKIRDVSKENFTIKDGSWLKMYDKYCCLINQRSIRRKIKLTSLKSRERVHLEKNHLLYSIFGKEVI
ncbi:MAG: hypothetical protein PHI32_08480 [Dysgonamonadaceae bacterium]|nr:hypothetical protein [Dysgonamonadaceae bacterium]MDD4728886.1 hypothetical protein [Dysgonamonadaceae bacterium]